MNNFITLVFSITLFLLGSTAFSAEGSQLEGSNFEKSDENLEMVVKTVTEVASSLDSLFPKPIKVVVVSRPEVTPIAVVVHKKRWCIVIINSSNNGWKNWGLVFNSGKMSRQEAIAFAAAHEIGHCLNKENAKNHPEEWDLLSGSDGELYADIFALSYVKATRSQADFHRIFESTVKFRKQFNFLFHPSHAISGRLNKSRQFFEQVPQSNFEPITTLAISMHVLKALEDS